MEKSEHAVLGNIIEHEQSQNNLGSKIEVPVFKTERSSLVYKHYREIRKLGQTKSKIDEIYTTI